MSFRMWVQEMWYEHINEQDSYGQPLRYTATEYFRKYRYWLKREYRYRKLQGTL